MAAERDRRCSESVTNLRSVRARAATAAQARADSERVRPKTPLLVADTALAEHVEARLRAKDSPMTISIELARGVHGICAAVSHETIYNALYVMPKGELRTDLLACLRQGRRVRRPRARGEDRRGRIQDMTSLHVRAPEVEDRLIPGHWESELRGPSTALRSAPWWNGPVGW